MWYRRRGHVNGLYEAAPDLLSILVSGNVMARGITLEGLTTTLFLRNSNSPTADTQMQMQRWFGYRGPYLYWCRVFLYIDQLDLFRAYHENDEALRAEVIGEMNSVADRAPSPLVLQGSRYRATGKIANLRALPLCPGPQPFVRVVDSGQYRDDNLNVLADLLDKGGWSELVVAGTERGLICDEDLSMLEVAAILESFQYVNHDPDPLGPNHYRWASLERELSLQAPIAPLFRPPGNLVRPIEAVAPQGCPYTVAAYLRLWNAALSRKARGLYPTDDHRTPWSMLNLAQYAASAPRFAIGVRFGVAGEAKHVRLRSHGVRCMVRSTTDGLVLATWGSRNPGDRVDAYLGDHLFDYHRSNLSPPPTVPGEPQWRPRGHPGLILFHVIKSDDTETVTVGVVLPLGGPDHFAALPPVLAGAD